VFGLRIEPGQCPVDGGAGGWEDAQPINFAGRAERYLPGQGHIFDLFCCAFPLGRGELFGIPDVWKPVPELSICRQDHGSGCDRTGQAAPAGLVNSGQETKALFPQRVFKG
jgi:hypothetical protein